MLGNMPRSLARDEKSWTIVVVALLTLAASSSAELDQLACKSSPCMYGICVDEPNDEQNSHRCYCIDGYTGVNCEINWDDCWSSPCRNGGTCNDAIAAYNCTCPEGFVGTNCEQRYSQCMSQPCQNNGTCLDQQGAVSCQCADGFSGDFCQVDASVCNGSLCMNGAECREGPGLSFWCECAEGWLGPSCEQDINECELPTPVCQNGGLCINLPGSYQCACLFGFTGRDCERPLVACDDNVCKNDAVCLLEDGQPRCYCVPDYHGPLCELRYDDCESKYARCENGGSCVDGINDFRCSCPAPYAGDYCTTMTTVTSTVATTITTPPPTVEGLTTAGVTTITTPTSIVESRTEAPMPTEVFTVTTVTSTGGVTSSSNITTMGGITTGGFTSSVTTTSGITTTTDIEAETQTHTSRNDTDSSIADTTLSEFSTTSQLHQHEDDQHKTTMTETTMKGMMTEMTMKGMVTETTMKGIMTETTMQGMVTETTMKGVMTETTMQGMITETTMKGMATETTMKGMVTETTMKGMVTETTIKGVMTETTEKATMTETTMPAAKPTIPSVFTDSETYSPATPTPTSQETPTSTAGTSPAPTLTVTPSAGVPVVTMLASTIPTRPTTPTTSVSDSTVPPTIDSGDHGDDFTSVTDFHRTTFGGEIDQATATAEYTTTTTSSIVVHTCTVEQCANITRCLFNASQCDCSYRDNCRPWSSRPDASISNAAFNGQSYIRQKFSFDGGALSVLVRLRTKAKSGILVHALFDDERYVLLYLEAGQLKFQFSCGLQTMLFGELDAPVNNGHEVDLETRFEYIEESASDRCSARLLVNGSLAMSGEQLLQTHETAPRLARLHLGGIPLAFSHQFPQIVLGFVGCMSLLKVNGIKRDFVRDSIEAVQIEECRSFACLSNPCRNFGACEEVNGVTRCKCIAGYSGPLCERSTCDDDPCHLGATCLVSPGANFVCVCPLGMHGMFCEKDTTIIQPSFSVFAPGFSSYMAYGVSASLKDSMDLRLRIVPQNLEQISLIAYMGQSGPKRTDSSDHFSLTYVRGYVMLTWDLGSGVRRIFTSSPIDSRSHKAHALRVGRRGRDAWLHVEGVGNVTGRAAGTNTRLDVSPILYIGGHKSKYFESLPHDLPLHTGFAGCIYDIELRSDDNVFPITMASPATGRGVGECHRNECSRHSCKNGAVCLNYGPTYSCICMKDWQGPDCSEPVNCTSSNSLCR